MARLELQLSDSKPTELLKVCFHHELLAEAISSVRGRTEGAYRGFGSFQWTPAVQALTLLFLRQAACQTSGKGGSGALLEGSASSAASSLDYALRKQPQWMSEMFGWDRQGAPLLRRFIQRSNSDRRRNAPVALGLQPRFARECEIVVSVENRQISSTEKLSELAEDLERNWRSKRSKPTEPATTIKDWGEELREFHEHEVTRALATQSIFDQAHLQNSVRSLLENPSFTRVAGKGQTHLHQLDADLYSANRFGVAEDESSHRDLLCGEEPIRCAIPCTLPTVILLFEYMRQVKGYNLELSYRHSHAVEIKNRILNRVDSEPPDICLLGIGPAASLLGSRLNEYHPLLFMPSLPQCILAPKGSSRTRSEINFGRYLLMQDDPTTASFYFDDLKRRGIIGQDTVAVEQSEPDEVFRALTTGDEDVRTILFFPYHLINSRFNNCEVLDGHCSELRDREVLLFVHEQFHSQPGKARAINVALRDAWLALLHDRKLRNSLIGDLLRDQEYSTYLRRCSGAYLQDVAV